MKIATKITLGYGILITLIVTLLVYHVSLTHRMESIQRDLSEVHFRAALTFLQLLRNLDQIEEYTQKFFVNGDQRYAAKLEEMQRSFGQDLQQLQILNRSPQEQVAVRQLSRSWANYAQSATEQELAFRLLNPSETANLRSSLMEHLQLLHTQTQNLFQATQAIVKVQVEKSGEATRRAFLISWGGAAIALVLSVLVSYWTVRSISEPLKNLIQGTRAIADGHFIYQLDTSRKDEFAQLACDFNAMTRRLGELDQMKKDFISHVSHELKSPLASMRETTRLLLDEVPGPLTCKQKRLLELTLDSAKRLSSMIANLLDLSRMEARLTPFEFKEHDLTSLLKTVLAEFESRISEKGLRIHTELPEKPVILTCDREGIIQVLGNLMDNALKFSPQDAALKLDLSRVNEIPEPAMALKRQEGCGTDFVLLSVADSGPGIPDPDKEKIFEKFHQVKNGGRRPSQGVGLGLAITRAIVEAHRGAVWAEDNPEGGSRFLVLLPATAAAHIVLGQGVGG